MSRKRKAIPKKVRFEVFKRDSFKCQYCGKSAPDVILQVDHIEPHSEGGSDDIMNLITSCFDCNIGKGKRRLDDDTVVIKSKNQADLLNERRQQLKMMMEWRKELLNQSKEQLKQVKDYWSELVSGYTLNETGLNSVDKLINRFGIEQVLRGMEIATRQYLIYDNDSQITKESVEEAFSKIGGICAIEKKSQKDPHIKDLYYIRGILRKRMYVNENYVMELLRNAISDGMDTELIKEKASTARNWTQFRDDLENYVPVKSHEPVDNYRKKINYDDNINLEHELAEGKELLCSFLIKKMQLSQNNAFEITDILGIYCKHFYEYLLLDEENINEDVKYLIDIFLCLSSFDKTLPRKYREFPFTLNKINKYIWKNNSENISFLYFVENTVEIICFPNTYIYDSFKETLEQIIWRDDLHCFEAIQSIRCEQFSVKSCINIGLKQALTKLFRQVNLEFEFRQVERLFRYYSYADILQCVEMYFSKYDHDGEFEEPYDPRINYSWIGFMDFFLNVGTPSFRAISGFGSSVDFMKLFEGIETNFEGVIDTKDGFFLKKDFKDWNDFQNSFS